MANWSVITPPGGPKPVEAARAAVLALRDKIPEARRAIETARTDLLNAERRDRETMAVALREGREVESDSAGVERARAAVGASERRAQALDLAIQTAEDELHEAVVRSRSQWAKTAEQRVAAARASAHEALTGLERSVGELRAAQALVRWLALEGGLDRESAAHPAVLGTAAGSARWSGNGDAVDLGLIFRWVGESIAPPPAPRPTPVQPLAPISSAMGVSRLAGR